MFYLYVNNDLVAVGETFSEIYHIIITDILDVDSVNVESPDYVIILDMINELFRSHHGSICFADMIIEVWYG